MGTKKALKDNTEGQYVGILRSHDRIRVFLFVQNISHADFIIRPQELELDGTCCKELVERTWNIIRVILLFKCHADLVLIFRLAGRTMKISEFGDLCGILLGRLPPTSAHHHHHPWHRHHQHLQHHLHHHRYHYRFCFVGGRKSLLLHSQVLIIIV